MAETFLVFDQGDEEGRHKYCVGIELKVGGRAVNCPLTEGSEDYGNVVEQISALQQELEDLKEQVRSKLSVSQEGVDLDFPPGTPAEEIWNRLCEIKEEEVFVRGFNSLSEEQRTEVADYVLTHCNIFSGRAAVFSARYDGKTTFME